MRDSLFRRFVCLFTPSKNTNRLRRGRSAIRRLEFQSLEPRQMFSADAIRLENLLPGAIQWQAAAPVPGDRPASPYDIPWNGYVDSTQLLFGDRIQGYTSRASYDLGEAQLAVDFKPDLFISV